MKPIIYILACLFATNTSVAQTQTTTHDEGENSGKVIVRQQSVQRVDSFLMIDLTLDLTPLIVKSSRSVELTPLLSGDGHQDTLPAMLINGRTRHLLYQRLPAKKRNASYVVQRKGQTAQTMEYNVRIPYLPWMEQSELKLITDLCGCGWEVLQQSTEPVAQMDFREPEEPQLLVEYIAPKHEAVRKCLPRFSRQPDRDSSPISQQPARVGKDTGHYRLGTQQPFRHHHSRRHQRICIA